MITTVKEIKQRLPLAEVYELRPDARYLILADAYSFDPRAFQKLAAEEQSPLSDIDAVVFFAVLPPGGELRDALAIYELEKSSPTNAVGGVTAPPEETAPAT